MTMEPGTKRILLAKTALDGHWRGLHLVAVALREAGFEVILGGMAEATAIARAATDEDADLLGLNVGGRVEVVERIVNTVWASRPELPVFAGGAIPPWAGVSSNAASRCTRRAPPWRRSSTPPNV